MLEAAGYRVVIPPEGLCYGRPLYDFGMLDDAKAYLEQALMQKMGLDYEILDSGCCGMSGSFGFEKEKYDVSIGAGERVLLPKVRGAAEDTLIITNGVSCREQIAETTNRQALHIAEVLHMAMDTSRGVLRDGPPERDIVQRRARVQRQANRRAAAMAGAMITGGVLLWGASRRRQQKQG